MKTYSNWDVLSHSLSLLYLCHCVLSMALSLPALSMSLYDVHGSLFLSPCFIYVTVWCPWISFSLPALSMSLCAAHGSLSPYFIYVTVCCPWLSLALLYLCHCVLSMALSLPTLSMSLCAVHGSLSPCIIYVTVCCPWLSHSLSLLYLCHCMMSMDLFRSPCFIYVTVWCPWLSPCFIYVTVWCPWLSLSLSLLYLCHCMMSMALSFSLPTLSMSLYDVHGSHSLSLLYLCHCMMSMALSLLYLCHCMMSMALSFSLPGFIYVTVWCPWLSLSRSLHYLCHYVMSRPLSFSLPALFLLLCDVQGPLFLSPSSGVLRIMKKQPALHDISSPAIRLHVTQWYTRVLITCLDKEATDIDCSCLVCQAQHWQSHNCLWFVRLSIGRATIAYNYRDGVVFSSHIHHNRHLLIKILLLWVFHPSPDMSTG